MLIIKWIFFIVRKMVGFEKKYKDKIWIWTKKLSLFLQRVKSWVWFFGPNLVQPELHALIGHPFFSFFPFLFSICSARVPKFLILIPNINTTTIMLTTPITTDPPHPPIHHSSPITIVASWLRTQTTLMAFDITWSVRSQPQTFPPFLNFCSFNSLFFCSYF